MLLSSTTPSQSVLTNASEVVRSDEVGSGEVGAVDEPASMLAPWANGKYVK